MYLIYLDAFNVHSCMLFGCVTLLMISLLRKSQDLHAPRRYWQLIRTRLLRCSGALGRFWDASFGTTERRKTRSLGYIIGDEILHSYRYTGIVS